MKVFQNKHISRNNLNRHSIPTFLVIHCRTNIVVLEMHGIILTTNSQKSNNKIRIYFSQKEVMIIMVKTKNRDILLLKSSIIVQTLYPIRMRINSISLILLLIQVLSIMILQITFLQHHIKVIVTYLILNFKMTVPITHQVCLAHHKVKAVKQIHQQKQYHQRDNSPEWMQFNKYSIIKMFRKKTGIRLSQSMKTGFHFGSEKDL